MFQKDMQEYWVQKPKMVGETDFLAQVGKTVNRQPISDEQFRTIVSDIIAHLDLTKTDVVLDLCCGNGLITTEIAKSCEKVIGIDFSRPLIEIAKRYHCPENVEYLCMSALDLDEGFITQAPRFNKVLMYEALQHFEREDLTKILTTILSLVSKSHIILLGSIPDSRKKWRFYNTPRRWKLYLRQKIRGRDLIGTWWSKNLIQKVCDELGVRCEFYEQSKELHTSYYRFDIKIV